MIDELRLAEPAGERHTAGQPKTRGESFQSIAIFSVAGDDGAYAGGLPLCQRFDQEVSALQRGQPRDQEHIVAVLIASIRALGCRGIEDGWAKLGPHCEPLLNRPRLDEQPGDIAGEEIPVRGADRETPHTFLQKACGTQPAAEAIPQVVILPHRVIQPAHVPGMPHGIARIAQADHLIDRLAVARADIGQPCGEIRRCLPPEPILRRHDDLCRVPGVAERLRERTGDHHMPPFRHRRAGRHDGNPAHSTSMGLTRTPRKRVSLSAP